MPRVLVIDIAGGASQPLDQALTAAGWEAVLAESPVVEDMAGIDAVILAVDGPALGDALDEVMDARSDAGTPIVLVTSLDRSGWDRTFGAAEALGVDALFDLPVDAHAVTERLKGILAAREEVQSPAAVEMSAILDRAVANEEAAAAFYRQVSERVTDLSARDALVALMKDEEEHKGLIEEFRSGARPLPKGKTSGGSLVETLGAPDFSPDMKPADAFLLAARKEKLAVEFYENWAGLYPEGTERDLLKNLAEIERRHKAKVEAMFTNAAFPEEW